MRRNKVRQATRLPTKRHSESGGVFSNGQENNYWRPYSITRYDSKVGIERMNYG